MNKSIPDDEYVIKGISQVHFVAININRNVRQVMLMVMYYVQCIISTLGNGYYFYQKHLPIVPLTFHLRNIM